MHVLCPRSGVLRIHNLQGWYMPEEKVKAILNAPQPQNVTELKSFLGLLNYY